jgi:hypothetical protein
MKSRLVSPSVLNRISPPLLSSLLSLYPHRLAGLMSQDIKEKISVAFDSEKVLEIEDTTVSSQDNHSIITNSDYSPDLQWTKEEEKKVVRKIDIRLMSWVLLMTFVLNMDRTNIGKYYNHLRAHPFT